MLDPKLVRSQTEDIAKRLAVRNYVFDTENFQSLESRRRTLQVKTEELQSAKISSRCWTLSTT